MGVNYLHPYVCPPCDPKREKRFRRWKKGTLNICRILYLSVVFHLCSLVVCISEASAEVEGSNRKPSIADLDNIFGPEEAPPAGEDRDDAWVCFSEESADRLQTQESAAPPPLPTSPPPPESPAPPLPTSPLSADQPGPPLPTSPPPKEEALPPLPSSPPPSEEPAAPPVPSGPHTPEDQNPPTLSTPPASTPPKQSVTPPTSSPPSIQSPTNASAPPAPKARTPPALTPPANGPGTDPLPPPPVSQEGQSKVNEPNQPKDGGGENVTSPSDSKQSSRSAHPPPPPPTYRATVSSPTPGADGTSSGEFWKSHFKFPRLFLLFQSFVSCPFLCINVK